jgi:hypothetical protein
MTCMYERDPFAGSLQYISCACTFGAGGRSGIVFHMLYGKKLVRHNNRFSCARICKLTGDVPTKKTLTNSNTRTLPFHFLLTLRAHPTLLAKLLRASHGRLCRFSEKGKLKVGQFSAARVSCFRTRICRIACETPANPHKHESQQIIRSCKETTADPSRIKRCMGRGRCDPVPEKTMHFTGSL